MKFLQDLVRMLLNSGTPVRVEECQDDRVYKQHFDVGGQDVEITNFDTDPKELKWGKWRCNQDGEPF